MIMIDNNVINKTWCINLKKKYKINPNTLNKIKKLKKKINE